MSEELHDVPKYRKKRNQKSKAKKRSGHKHEYERVIIGYPGGWGWGKKCSICERMEQVWTGSYDQRENFMKLRESVKIFDYYEALSPEEVREKFPSIPIYKMAFEDGKYLGFKEIV